jgi:hypothetical protein
LHCVGVVGIVKTGKTIGDDLSSGPGGGFSSLLIGELLGGLGSSSSHGQIVLGCRRQSALGAGNDKYLFELVEVGCRAKLYEGIGLVLEIGFDGLDGSDWKAARIDLIAA